MAQVNTPTNLLDRIRDLERQIGEVRKRVGLGNATISRGDLTVQEGGTFRLLHPNGTQIAKIGNLGVVGDEEVWGVSFSRADGSDAITVYSTESGGLDFVAFRDKASGVILSDDGLSGHGMATPYLPYGPVGMSANSDTWSKLPGTTSSSFSTVWETYVPLTHPRVRVLAYFDSSDSASPGEGRVLLDGVTLDSTTFGTNGVYVDGTYDVPGWGIDRPYLHEAHFQVQVRRTSGSGRAVSAVYSLYGAQS